MHVCMYACMYVCMHVCMYVIVHVILCVSLVAARHAFTSFQDAARHAFTSFQDAYIYTMHTLSFGWYLQELHRAGLTRRSNGNAP